ncbi:MAG: cysteine--tRNA ligase [Elusimicrobiota bacterium]|nr:cysteine--tRNA ligase [Elusimicrobiota bacterium]
MAIKIYNTLSNRKEDFIPQKENEISMYVCGITPYDDVHLGHARAYVAFDIIKRHFIKRGFTINHVQNFTDVDDKIVARSQEKKIKPSELVKTYIDDYFLQMEKLNILKAKKYPKVTEMIVEIIRFIQILLDREIAYEIDGNVYFSIEKFKDYGKLSKRNIDDLKTRARISTDENKRNAYDFSLWKKAKENEGIDSAWDSPWGKGRPGWHIECSVMASEFLGDTIDIHGGGQDLIFPHHENEIAQSESKTGKTFVKYWIHNGFVTVNKEKMSKSLNNFFTLKDIFDKYNPRVVRYYFLTQHYKSQLDFSDAGLQSARSALAGLDEAYFRLSDAVSKISKVTDKDLLDLQDDFFNSLDDDFNSEKALVYIHELKNIILNELGGVSEGRLAQLKNIFEDLMQNSLGITLQNLNNDCDENLQKLLDDRIEARKNKNWELADNIRKQLDEKGYKIVDNKDGTSVLVKKI